MLFIKKKTKTKTKSLETMHEAYCSDDITCMFWCNYELPFYAKQVPFS